MKLLIRNICQPENTNPYGTGHGGWITTQIAHGGIYYSQIVSGGAAVLTDVNVIFNSPKHLGKFICIYGDGKSVIGSKMTFSLEARRVELNKKEVLVAAGSLSYVAVGKTGKPRKFKANLK